MINPLDLNLKYKGQDGARTIKEYLTLIEKKVNDLIDNLYYQPGEQIIVNGYFSGCLTGGNEWILFTINTPKLLDKVSNATIDGSVVIRHADGGYIQENSPINSLGTITMNRKKDNQITFHLSFNEKKLNFANNSVVSVEVLDCKITFS